MAIVAARALFLRAEPAGELARFHVEGCGLVVERVFHALNYCPDQVQASLRLRALGKQEASHPAETALLSWMTNA